MPVSSETKFNLSGGVVVRFSAKRLAAVALIASTALCASPGCNNPPVGAEADVPTFGDRPMNPVTKDSSVDHAQYVLLVHAKLVWIEAPAGTISQSEDLWSYLRSEFVDPDTAETLGWNGIRLGKGDEEHWPDIADILQRITGEALNRTNMLLRPGSPNSIILKSGHRGHTIFMCYPDRTISGTDYPPGDDLLTVVCTLNEDDPSRFMLTAVPQVRSSRRRPEIIQRNKTPFIKASPRLYTLDLLRFRAGMSPGEFLVIGPGPESRRESSPGHQFLVHTRQGVKFERVLVLAPKVYAASRRSDKHSTSGKE